MTSTITYEGLPLSATETSPEVRSYGIHPVPISTETSAFELPTLIGQRVADVPSGDTWKKWGRWKRSELSEAWHFYAADIKFESILREPFKLVDTGASYAVEVNVSSYGDDPLPVALSGMWRKRCVSRIWQEAGVNVFIDLFADGWARELTLQGVPRSHCLYATKYAKADLTGKELGMAGVLEDFMMAADHCDDLDSMVFAVYGGGNKVAEVCRNNNWLYLPAFNTRRIAEELANG